MDGCELVYEMIPILITPEHPAQFPAYMWDAKSRYWCHFQAAPKDDELWRYSHYVKMELPPREPPTP